MERFNEEANGVIGQHLNHKLNAEMGPIFLVTTMDKDALDTLPVPGSTEGNNSEIYYEKKKKDDGTVSEKKRNRFDPIVKETSAGSEIATELEKMKPAEGQKLNGSAKSKQKTLRNQLAGIKTLLRVTAGIHHNMTYINENIDGVTVTLFTNKDKSPAKSKYPIRIRGGADEDDVVMAASTFAKLDLSRFETVEGKSNLEKVEACGGRAPREPGEGMHIKGTKQFVDVMLGVMNFVDDEDLFKSLTKITDAETLRYIGDGLNAADAVAKLLSDKLKGIKPSKESKAA